MTPKTSKAPLVGAGGALGIVYHGQAIDIRDIPPSLAEVQTNFVARRARLDKTRAALVAALAFERAA